MRLSFVNTDVDNECQECKIMQVIDRTHTQCVLDIAYPARQLYLDMLPQRLTMKLQQQQTASACARVFLDDCSASPSC